MKRQTYVSDKGFTVDQELGIRYQLNEKIIDSLKRDLAWIKEVMSKNDFYDKEYEANLEKLEKEIEKLRSTLSVLNEKIYHEFIINHIILYFINIS